MSEESPKPKKRLRYWLISLFVAFIIALGIKGCIDFRTNFIQSMGHPVVAEFCSPTHPDYRLFLFEEGFVDRSMLVCIPDTESDQTDGPEIWNAIYDDFKNYMHQIAWTKDGQVVAISSADSPRSWAAAYDFKNKQYYIKGSPEASGEQPSIYRLINEHGGLHEDKIDMDRFRAEAKDIGYWKVPNINHKLVPPPKPRKPFRANLPPTSTASQ